MRNVPLPSCANSYVKRELIVVGSSPTPCNKLLSVVTKKEVRQTRIEYGFACLLFLAVCHYLDPDNLQYGETWFAASHNSAGSRTDRYNCLPYYTAGFE